MPANAEAIAMMAVPANLSDLDPDRFVEELDQLLTTRPQTVTLDCSHLEHVTSSHVNYLWQAHERCEQSGATLKLSGTSPNLWRILELLDLAEFFAQGKTAELRLYDSRFQATKDGIGAAMLQFVEFLKDQSVPAVTAFELQTLFYEVATNIRLHGHLDQPQSIKFRTENTDNRIKMIFQDSGRPFDPTAVRLEGDLRNAAKRGQMRGFGLVMINRLADKVTYRRVDNSVNELTVTKRWSV